MSCVGYGKAHFIGMSQNPVRNSRKNIGVFLSFIPNNLKYRIYVKNEISFQNKAYSNYEEKIHGAAFVNKRKKSIEISLIGKLNNSLIFDSSVMKISRNDKNMS